MISRGQPVDEVERRDSGRNVASDLERPKNDSNVPDDLPFCPGEIAARARPSSEGIEVLPTEHLVREALDIRRQAEAADQEVAQGDQIIERCLSNRERSEHDV